jgi:hypothetical protein
VDLVDEEDVVGLEVGEDRREVARALQHRPRGVAHAHAHLPGDDVGKCRLAQARRTEKQHVVERFLAIARRGDEDAQLLADLLLPDVLVEVPGAKRALLAVFLRRGRAPRDQAVGFDHVFPRCFSAWRIASVS